MRELQLGQINNYDVMLFLELDQDVVTVLVQKMAGKSPDSMFENSKVLCIMLKCSHRLGQTAE